MKKRFLLSVLIVAPLLASCKGAIISADAAKDISKNIKENFSKLDYDKFTFKVDEKDSKNQSLTAQVIYDKNGRYYHSYSIKNNEIVERWYYAKTNADGAYRFYDCVRHNGAIDTNGFPAVKVKDFEYKDELWDAVVASTIAEIGAYLTFALTGVDASIAYKAIDDKAVTLSSLNDMSICSESSKDNVKSEYIIDDGKLTSYKVETNETKYKRFECSYKKASIIYLNI